MYNKVRKKVALKVLVTGGTFDKEYDEITGKLYFKETHMTEILELGRSRVDVNIEKLMLIDSLDMTPNQRELIVSNCLESEENQIVITHGTDTMTITGKMLAEKKRISARNFGYSVDFTIGDETLEKKPYILDEIAYRDTWGLGSDSFLSMIYERLILMKELLAEDGSIFVHCDGRLNNLIKIIIQEIFGKSNFRNEIVWERSSSGKTISKN